MFSNGKVVTSGAVGIGMFPRFESIEHGYQGLEPISDPVKVTRCDEKNLSNESFC